LWRQAAELGADGATLLAKSQCGLLDVLVKEGFCGIILDVKEDFLCRK